MECITKTTHKLPVLSEKWLISNGFTYNRLYSDEEIEVYTYRFPVYKYGIFAILDAELKVVVGENCIQINVFDHNTINRYAPFYYCEYGNYDKVLKIINNNIRKQVDKFGIKKIIINKKEK